MGSFCLENKNPGRVVGDNVHTPESLIVRTVTRSSLSSVRKRKVNQIAVQIAEMIEFLSGG